LVKLAQANPSVAVVERLEDLWLLSKLQRERKVAAGAALATRRPDTPVVAATDTTASSPTSQLPRSPLSRSGKPTAYTAAEASQSMLYELD
jgi:hypothetical protein